MAGLDLVHIPYKGGAPSCPRHAGRVNMILRPPSSLAVQSGKLRAWGCDRRDPPLPSPTIGEAGLPGYDSVTGWVVRAREYAAPVVARCSVFKQAIQAPEIEAQLLPLGLRA